MIEIGIVLILVGILLGLNLLKSLHDKVDRMNQREMGDQ
jgi:hypothetical protein